MIRVLLADDHVLVRTGLERLLGGADGIEVVGTAENGLVAVELAGRLAPDVILMDLEMPVVDGIEATRQIVAASPGIAIVVLTSFSDRERILRALDAGAVGYLLKDAEPDELVRGIRAAAAGESPLAPRAATALVQARAASESVVLTPREREVLLLVMKGHPNKRIARELGISEKTVKTHLTSIFATIGVTDRTQAALWGHRTGIG